jgi:hypothetical protein
MAQWCGHARKDFGQVLRVGPLPATRFRALAMSPGIFQRRRFDNWLRERLGNEALERYLDWRAESEAVDEAYGVWSGAPTGEAELSFAAYGAALDREERAATVYGSVIDRIERLLAGEREVFAAPSGAARP